MATWIVGGVLLVIVGAVKTGTFIRRHKAAQKQIDKQKADKKSGNSACSCGGDCGKCKGCH